MSDSFDTLLADGVIDAVLGQLKTGKEAEVWLVQHAEQVVAAKLYKERHARNFRNNAAYKEGREVRNSRTRRAMEKGSRFGQAAAEEAWKSAEADALYTLHAQGVRVPTPVMFYEGVLLMELVVDAEGHPAPRLVEAPPSSPEEAHALYLDLRAQVVRMLCADLIHGDLSPYNILRSWAGPVIIDFPQTVAAARNNRAEFYFQRDLDNVRTFLAGYDSRLRGMAGDTAEIWNAYVRRELTPDFVPSGTWREAPRRNGSKGPREGQGAPRAGSGGPRSGGERRPWEERRGEPRAERPAREAVQAVPAAEGLSAEEAELRQLEAMFLRQGGGERGKPPPSGGGRDGRRRPLGAGGAGGPRGSSARPAQGGARSGSGPRPAPGGQRGGAPGAPAVAQRSGGGQRPQAGEPRNGGGQRVQSGEPRNAGGPRAPSGEPRNGHPRPPQGAPRNGNPARTPIIEQRGGPRMPAVEQRNGPPARTPAVEQRNGGGPRTPAVEQRNGPPARTPAVEQRNGGGPRMPAVEQRNGGGPRTPAVEQRNGGGPRMPPVERRTGGGPRMPLVEQRNGGTARMPVVEQRSGALRPPQGAPRGGGEAWARPGEPRGDRAPTGERRAGGPGRLQSGLDARPRREASRPPQVSRVSRPGPPETES